MSVDVQNSTARRAKLEKLVAQLTRQEQRELKQMMIEDTFQYDILGNLPVELGAIVVSYLDIIETDNYRSVCRAWRTLFQQAIVQDSILEQWVDPAKSFSSVDRRKRDEHFLHQFRIARSFLTASPHHTFHYQFSRFSVYALFYLRRKPSLVALFARQVTCSTDSGAGTTLLVWRPNGLHDC